MTHAHHASATRPTIRNSILAQSHGVVLDSMLLQGGVAALLLLAMGGSELEVGLIFTLHNAAIMGRVFAAPHLDTGRLKRIVYRWQGIASIAGVLVLLVYLLAMRWEPTVGRWGVVLMLGVYFFARQMGQAAWPPLMSQIIPPRLRGRFFGRMRSYLRLAGFGAILLAGLMLGQDPAAWRFVPLLALGLAIFGLRLYFLHRLPDPDPPRDGEAESFVCVIARPLRDGPYRRFVSITFLVRVLPVLTMPFVVPFLVAELGVPSAYAVYATAAAMVGAIVTLNMWGRMADRWGSRSTYTLSLVSLACSGAIYAMAPAYATAPWLTLAFAALGFAMHGSATAGIGIAEVVRMMRQSPDAFRGSYMTVVFAAHGLAGAGAALFGGLLLSTLPTELPLLDYSVYTKRLYFGGVALLAVLSIAALAGLKPIGEPRPRHRFDPLIELASLAFVPPIGYIRAMLKRRRGPGMDDP